MEMKKARLAASPDFVESIFSLLRSRLGDGFWLDTDLAFGPVEFDPPVNEAVESPVATDPDILASMKS
jgi:hypothetical protein